MHSSSMHINEPYFAKYDYGDTYEMTSTSDPLKVDIPQWCTGISLTTVKYYHIRFVTYHVLPSVLTSETTDVEMLSNLFMKYCDVCAHF